MANLGVATATGTDFGISDRIDPTMGWSLISGKEQVYLRVRETWSAAAVSASGTPMSPIAATTPRAARAALPVPRFVMTAIETATAVMYRVLRPPPECLQRRRVYAPPHHGNRSRIPASCGRAVEGPLQARDQVGQVLVPASGVMA